MSVLKPKNLNSILKDSFIIGLITLVLAVPIVGLPTINATEGLQIEPRWSVVVLMVLGVFFGRLLLNLWWHREPNLSSSTIIQNIPLLQSLQQLLKFILPIGLIFALILPTMPFASRYVMDVAILVITYIMLGWGLNIVVGLAGLLDLGYVAFYAIGAYSYALLANYFDWSFWICLPMAGVFAGISGILLGFPVLRLRGDYLAIVTLGFGEIIRVILLNWYEFTGGPDGISGIPRPSFFGLEFKRSSEGTFSGFFGLDYSSMHRIIFLYYLILALALLTNFVTLRLRKLPVGRAWEALREDEIACRSLGINPTNTKLTAFAIGATFGGLAGSFFATRQGFISPESFTFIESAVILAIVVLGGMGSQIGVVLASVVLIGGTELFRELEEYRMLAFGALMVGIMIWKPRGLLANREPTIRIKVEGSS
ncbi:MAG: branched-chain amino acid ABC transporter permease [SAR324 cluster bacterium]|uniref:Branched-chain amino acid ABC transporter permease n=1 Tax=SAR324 cluster bacterium TaxID=2024889 RepID=A0A2D6YLU8_9DELT|nr:branched-chain amino acid ABC transporter permease [SAR324 cluster bacterium]